MWRHIDPSPQFHRGRIGTRNAVLAPHDARDPRQAGAEVALLSLLRWEEASRLEAKLCTELFQLARRCGLTARNLPVWSSSSPEAFVHRGYRCRHSTQRLPRVGFKYN